MQENAHTQPAKKNSLLPIILTVFIDMLGVNIALPVIALLFLDHASGIFPQSVAEPERLLYLGALIASYPIAQFFGAPIFGGLSDRHGRKKILLIALAGTFAGYLMFAFGIITSNIWLLFLGRAIDGLTGGSIAVAMSAIADLSDEKEKSKNFGLVGMAFGFGFIIGPYAGGKLADSTIVSWFSYSTPFLFAAALCALNIALVLWRFEETLHTKVDKKLDVFTGIKNLRKAAGSPALRTIFAVGFLYMFGFAFFTQFSQVYYIERFHFNESQIGDLFAYLGVFIVLTQGVLNRIISPRFEPKAIMSFTIILTALSIFAVTLPPEAWMLYLVVPFLAIFHGLTFPNYTAIVSNSAGKESQGEIMGINQSIQAFAMSIPPMVSGAIAAVDSRYPVYAATLMVALAWIVFVLFYHKPKPVFHEE